MNNGHVLVIIIASFIVVQTLAIGVYKYLSALADKKMMEAAFLDRQSREGTSKPLAE